MCERGDLLFLPGKGPSWPSAAPRPRTASEKCVMGAGSQFGARSLGVWGAPGRSGSSRAGAAACGRSQGAAGTVRALTAVEEAKVKMPLIMHKMLLYFVCCGALTSFQTVLLFSSDYMIYSR